MLLRRAGPVPPDSAPLDWTMVATPVPAEDELLVRVSVCAVCRTDLDVVEGRVVAPHYPVIPGHQIVGRVAAVGGSVTGFRVGERVGIAWIHHACGTCRWCLTERENLCPWFESTGCDANGGYAEFATVPAAFAVHVPIALSDVAAAPLLCAGAIGWRSLRLANLRDGDPLGLTGFGASAHVVLQLARHLYPGSPVYVTARSEAERAFARHLGAAWAGDSGDDPPDRMGAIIDTTPAWKPVVDALPRLLPGGRLVVNAIRKTAGDEVELTRVDYATHLWMEREIQSVANVTRQDVREMLAAAVDLELRPTVDEMPLDRANEALARIKSARDIRGATVLRVADSVPTG